MRNEKNGHSGVIIKYPFENMQKSPWPEIAYLTMNCKMQTRLKNIFWTRVIAASPSARATSSPISELTISTL